MTAYQPECDLCGAPAAALWDVPGGCVARPDLTTQALCHQHEHSLPDGAIDGYSLVAEFTPPIN